jgi:hypothetical protein
MDSACSTQKRSWRKRKELISFAYENNIKIDRTEIWCDVLGYFQRGQRAVAEFLSL